MPVYFYTTNHNSSDWHELKQKASASINTNGYSVVLHTCTTQELFPTASNISTILGEFPFTSHRVEVKSNTNSGKGCYKHLEAEKGTAYTEPPISVRDD